MSSFQDEMAFHVSCSHWKIKLGDGGCCDNCNTCKTNLMAMPSVGTSIT